VPLRNRVTPFGDVIETPARGLLFGNRGILHDEDRRLVRTWNGRRWIACRLAFKGWHRDPMPPRSYTGLFFLDEATSLAAGHRPCAECRRQDYLRFRNAWRATHPGGPWMAEAMDRVLHAERLASGGSKRLHPGRLNELHDGVMVADEGRAWLVLGAELLEWTPFGYAGRRARTGAGTMAMLTPPGTVATIRAGYVPAVHPSAGRA
jgi:hypothetical protein